MHCFNDCVIVVFSFQEDLGVDFGNDVGEEINVVEKRSCRC